MSVAFDHQKTIGENVANALVAIANNGDRAGLGNVLFVDGNRTDDYTADGTMAGPYKTIAAAKDASASGDVLIVAPGAYAEVVTLTTGTSLFGWQVTGTTLTGNVTLFNGTSFSLASPIMAGTASTSVTVTSPVEQHTNATSFKVDAGSVVFNETSADADFRVESNGNTAAIFVDAGNDRVGILTPAPTVPLDVTGEALFTGKVAVEGGVFVFNNGAGAHNFTVTAPVELHTNATSHTVVSPMQQLTATTSVTHTTPIVDFIMGTTGGLALKKAEAVSGVLSGSTGSIAVNVPSGALMIGTQLRVDEIITSGDGGTTFGAIFATGSTATIAANTTAFAANTKVNTFFNAYAATNITTGTTTITVAPNSGTFSAGKVRAIVYYYAFDTMASL